MFVIDQSFILDQAININLFESRVVNKLYNFQILGMLKTSFFRPNYENLLSIISKSSSEIIYVMQVEAPGKTTCAYLIKMTVALLGSISYPRDQQR